MVPQGDTKVERNPKLPATTLTQTMKFSPAHLRRPFYAAAFPKKATFPLEQERVLDTLYVTPEVSRDTRPHSKGTLSFWPQVKMSPIFPASSRDEGQLLPFAWKGMPTSPSHLERRLISNSPQRATRGPCHNSKATYFPIL